MLAQEYEMRAKMDLFERSTKHLVKQLHTYSLVEFYTEEESLKEKIMRLRISLDGFNIYLPQTRVIL